LFFSPLSQLSPFSYPTISGRNFKAAQTWSSFVFSSAFPALPSFLPPYSRVWFQGGTDMEQLGLMLNMLGVPDEFIWPGVSQLKTYVPFKKKVRGLKPNVQSIISRNCVAWPLL
jgi:hypothetical protein